MMRPTINEESNCLRKKFADPIFFMVACFHRIFKLASCVILNIFNFGCCGAYCLQVLYSCKKELRD